MNVSLKNAYTKLLLQYNEEVKLKKDKTIMFKIIAARKFMKILNQIDFEITSGKQLESIDGVGKKTMAKVDEILGTGKLKTTNSFIVTNSIKSEQELRRITGIGPAKAKKLVEQKISLPILQSLLATNKIDVLKQYLTHHQIIGLKYLNDIEQKIPSSEITYIGDVLKKVLSKINKNLEMVVCGSYRRGKSESNDIDVLIHCKYRDRVKLFPEIIRVLIHLGILVDHLTPNPQNKYMGLLKIGKYARRIDMKYVGRRNLATGLLYFTGSGDFNINMRKFATKKGYKLNEYGLYKLKANKEPGLKMKTTTEKDVFKILKIPYIEPKDRTLLIKFDKL
tara:strand:+ start:907 stop:1914 length:1008 start_codon:yes stop_codon:yes gene_type:complete